MSSHSFDDDDKCTKCGDRDWYADSKCSESKIKSSMYCPICSRVIVASNMEEVKTGEHDGYIFVHDDIVHSDSDLEALNNSLN